MKRHAGAALTMVVGTASIVLLLVVLNRPPPDKAQRAVVDAVGFDVPRAPPPPPRVKKRRPKKAKNPRTAPPAPVLGASLAGLDLGLDAGGDLLGELSDGLLGEAGDVVMTEDAVDQPPRPVARTAPRYPVRARSKGLTGLVVLRILVGSTGEVLQVKVDRADPPGVFDEAALEAARSWRFEPARYHGAAVKSWVRQPVRFDLEAAG